MTDKNRFWRSLAGMGFLPGASCRLCGCRSLTALCDSCQRDLRPARHVCRYCAARLGETNARCGQCIGEDFYYDALTAPFDYRFPLDRVLGRFKYQPDLALLPAFRLMLQSVEHELPRGIQALLPVPLHASRQRQRGFNQATLIAELISQCIGVPVTTNLALRQRKTVAQATLSRDERGQNMAGAFVASKAAEGAHVCLVDDVVTTGATLDALAQACKKAGAVRVTAFAIARA